MTDVKDLQIGDWVQNQLGYKAQVLDIHYIKDEGDGYGGGYRIHIGKSNWGVVQWLEEKDIEPIPLTAEILEKNGFTNEAYFAKLVAGEYAVICDCSNVAILQNDEMKMDIPIKYVHELQHALKLCGIDKEITL